MDPNATLARISDTLFDASDDCLDACRDLANWLCRGGFSPDWTAHPAGARRFKRYAPHLYKRFA